MTATRDLKNDRNPGTPGIQSSIESRRGHTSKYQSLYSAPTRVIDSKLLPVAISARLTNCLSYSFMTSFFNWSMPTASAPVLVHPGIRQLEGIGMIRWARVDRVYTRMRLHSVVTIMVMTVCPTRNPSSRIILELVVSSFKTGPDDDLSSMSSTGHLSGAGPTGPTLPTDIIPEYEPGNADEAEDVYADGEGTLHVSDSD